jgi:hypothetical protein
VAKGQRQGIGPIGGSGHLRQVEQDLYHPLNLRFAGVAPTRNGLLDLVRAVLDDGNAGFGRGG